MAEVLNINDIVKEYLPEYKNVKEFMKLFTEYFPDQFRYKNIGLKTKKYYALVKYIRDNLPKDFKNDREKSLKFIENFENLETYYNRSSNVRKPEAIHNRELTRIKLITYWPFSSALEDEEYARVEQEREAKQKEREEIRIQYLMSDKAEESAKRKRKREREEKEKETLKFLDRIDRQDEEKKKIAPKKETMPPNTIKIKDIIAKYLPGYENIREFRVLFHPYFKYAEQNPNTTNPYQPALIEFLKDSLTEEFESGNSGLKVADFIKKYNQLRDQIHKLSKKGSDKRKRAIAKRQEIVYRPIYAVLSTMNFQKLKKLIAAPKIDTDRINKWYRDNFEKIRTFFEDIQFPT
jgi:ATPase subunit of ABC transporter with duplicated ATPase domains